MVVLTILLFVAAIADILSIGIIVITIKIVRMEVTMNKLPEKLVLLRKQA